MAEQVDWVGIYGLAELEVHCSEVSWLLKFFEKSALAPSALNGIFISHTLRPREYPGRENRKKKKMGCGWGKGCVLSSKYDAAILIMNRLQLPTPGLHEQT